MGAASEVPADFCRAESDGHSGDLLRRKRCSGGSDEPSIVPTAERQSTGLAREGADLSNSRVAPPCAKSRTSPSVAHGRISRMSDRRAARPTRFTTSGRASPREAMKGPAANSSSVDVALLPRRAGEKANATPTPQHKVAEKRSVAHPVLAGTRHAPSGCGFSATARPRSLPRRDAPGPITTPRPSAAVDRISLCSQPRDARSTPASATTLHPVAHEGKNA